MRPWKKTEQVQTTLTPDDRDRLDSYASACSMSRATAIRVLLLQGLAEDETRRAAAARKATTFGF